MARLKTDIILCTVCDDISSLFGKSSK